MANKLARTAWAVWIHETDFTNEPSRGADGRSHRHRPLAEKRCREQGRQARNRTSTSNEVQAKSTLMALERPTTSDKSRGPRWRAATPPHADWLLMWRLSILARRHCFHDEAGYKLAPDLLGPTTVSLACHNGRAARSGRRNGTRGRNASDCRDLASMWFV